jgi:hypothetical protein
MLAEQATQLLTAFVDGELSQRQRKAVVRLLHRSSEARELLRQLQENAHRVKLLPRRKVTPTLVNDVLQTIAERHLEPREPVELKRSPRLWKPYLAVSMAASLLIGALGLLYWQSINSPDGLSKDNGPGFAASTPIKKKPEALIAPGPKVQPSPTPAPPRAPNPMVAKLVDGTFGSFNAPLFPDAFVSGAAESLFAGSFRELQKEGPATGRLVDQLNRDRVVQFDITVKNNSVAMERLKAALHERRIKLIVDPDAERALNAEKALKKKSKVEYLVYAENLTTDEVAKMLKDLGMNNTTGKKNEPSPYEKIKVTPLGTKEKTKIAGALGIDFGTTDKGSKNNDWERTAVVLPVSASPSAEIRRFAEQKRRPQAGAVQVLIKIHQD